MLSQGTLHFLSHILPYSTLCVSLHHLFSIYLSIIQIRLSFHGPKRVWRLSPAVSLIFLNIYLFACLHQGLLLSLCHVCVYPSAYCTNCPIHKTSVAYCTELKGKEYRDIIRRVTAVDSSHCVKDLDKYPCPCFSSHCGIHGTKTLYICFTDFSSSTYTGTFITMSPHSQSPRVFVFSRQNNGTSWIFIILKALQW